MDCFFHKKEKLFSVKISFVGLIPPTSGTAIVNGYDIRENIDGVRSSLGICPQHDVLFDELTVKEHLYFFCKVL